jgi:hypothetical protein
MLERGALQEGLVARYQLPELDLGPDAWKAVKRAAGWRVESARVVRHLAAPRTETQRLLLAVLDASPAAFLHGPTVLARFGMPGYNLREIHVARVRDISGLKSTRAIVHQIRDLRAVDVLLAGGVPSETPLRAIWALAAPYAAPRLFEVGMDRIGNLLDAAHRRKLVTWLALRQSVEDLHESGRYGTTLMRALADKRPPGSSPNDSRNEDQLARVLDEHGIRPLRAQVPLGGETLIGRCDFRDPDLPLAVEVNSVLWHTTPSDVAADLVRYQRLNVAGFTVAVIWDDDLWGNRRSVVRTLNEGRRLAAAGQCVVIHSAGCPWPGALVIP